MPTQHDPVSGHEEHQPVAVQVSLMITAAVLLMVVAALTAGARSLAGPFAIAARTAACCLVAVGCSVPIVLLGSLAARLFGLARLGLDGPKKEPVPWTVQLATCFGLGSTVVIGIGLLLLALGCYTPLVWHGLAYAAWLGIALWQAATRYRMLAILAGAAGNLARRIAASPVCSWQTVLLALLATAALHSAVPPNARDELAYHLVLPQLWEATASWWLPTDNFHLLFPANGELLWAYAGAVGGILGPRIMTFVLSLLALLLVWELLPPAEPGWTKSYTLVFLIAAPATYVALATCYVEWVLVFYLVLGWWWVRPGGASGRSGVMIAALSWATALGAKYTAMIVVPCLAAELLIRHRRAGWQRVAAAAAAMAVATALLAAPWWLRNLAAVGDPVAPLGGMIGLGSGLAPGSPAPGGLTSGGQAPEAAGSHLLSYSDIPGRWRLWPVLYHGTATDWADDRLHPLWPVLQVLVLALGWRWRRTQPWIAALLATAALLPFNPAPRNYLPLLLLYSLFLPGFLGWTSRGRGRQVVASGLLAAALLMSLPFSLSCLFLRRQRAVQDYLLGRCDRQTMLIRDGFLPVTVLRVRDHTPAAARVWSWCEDRTLYLDRWVRADPPYGRPRFLQLVEEGGGQALSAAIEQDRIDLVWLNHRYCPDSWTHALRERGNVTFAPEQQRELERWSRDHLEELARDEEYVLFRIIK